MPFRTSQKDEEDLLPFYDNHFMAMSVFALEMNSA